MSKNDGKSNINFPLMLGGLLYWIYSRTHLLKPPLNLCKRRIIVITLLAWLPLLLLNLLEGTLSKGVKVPFLFDLDTHLRLLISLGIFIAADLITHQQMQIIVPQFVERDIISSDVRTKFNKLIASALTLGNSYIAELLLLVFIYTGGHFIWKYNSLAGVSTWYFNTINEQTKLTMAGYWYVYFSIPLFQFILCRWYYRFFIWCRFLWQVSRLPLQLNCLHPDRAGGLGFLNMSLTAFSAGLLAHTVLLTGWISNRILFAGQTLHEFQLEIVSILLFLLILVFTPLLFFIIPLAQVKLKGLSEYGIVASDYVNSFYSKWIGKKHNKSELLGNSDFQSLSDLSNSFSVANEMRLIPFNRQTFIQVLLLISIPLLPLLLTIIPLSGMINKVIQVLF